MSGKATQRELESPYDEPTRAGKPFAPLWAVELHNELIDRAYELRKFECPDEDIRTCLDVLASVTEGSAAAVYDRFDWSREE